jgi:hypothetical protein
MALGSRLLTVLALGGLLVVAGGLVLLPSRADARAFVAFGVGVPFFAAPGYYYPPPVVAYPPPVYYGPPAVAYAPGAAYAPSAPVAQQSQQYCREYQTTSIINGRPQQVFGTACLQPDGTWRIVK